MKESNAERKKNRCISRREIVDSGELKSFTVVLAKKL